MSEQHTPGPWNGGLITQGQPIGDEVIEEVAKQRGRTLGAITTGDGRFVAILASTDDTIEEDRANARLIAAAPDLVEALEGIFAHFDRDDQAPGHAHTIIGVWDNDKSNGEKAGTPCAWCAHWAAARAAIAKAKGETL